MKMINKMALVAVVGVVISGCGFFDDLFGSESLSTSNAKAAVISAKGKLGDGKSMCSKFSKSEIFGNSDYRGEILANIGNFLFDGKYSVAQVERKIDMQVHYVDIKDSEKESTCYYIRTVNTAFENIKLTSQDIEQFERFLAQRSEYEDKDDERILYTLKFFKYYNMTDKFYQQYDKAKESDIYRLEHFVGSGCISFVYGTKQRDCRISPYGIDGLMKTKEEFGIDEPFMDIECKEKFPKENNANYIVADIKKCQAYYKPIYQWQKSIIEQSKQPKQKAAK